MIRIGVQWAPALEGAELKEFARELEDLGYFSLGFPDHFFIGHKDPLPTLEPFSAMAFAAAVTTRLRLVSIVAANDFRNPALFARSIASLDMLSAGRIEAGIGAGWYGPEFDAVGIVFDKPSIRIERLEEAIGVAKAYWTKDIVEHAGKYYSVNGLPRVLDVVQQPHPPLLIGAGGDKMLALAGRHADVVGLTSSLRDFENRERMLDEMRPSSIARKVALVRSSAVDAGRDLDQIIFQTQINSIDFDQEDPGHLWALTGEPSKMMETLEERAEMGITYFMLRERRRDVLREFGEKVVSKL
ncbi:MAG: LLM class flavin-dependent oxidoreductase [Actinomycetota bacterium]|nr:LLM class flavin-dependent oxidoreductase [Actinomycetota bacterium]